MHSISPVWTSDLIESERVIALDQPEYAPIIILPIQYMDGSTGMTVRFQFNDDERTAIAAGANLIICEMTNGQFFTPLALGVAMPGEEPKL